MINKFSVVLASAAIATGTIATLATAPAHAATCAVSNVTLGDMKANACKGSFGGNDTGGGTLLTDLNNGLFNIGANATWDLIGKSDEGPVDITAAKGSTTGAWSLTQSLADSGLSTFAISLKAANSYSVYLFQDVDFSVTGLEGIFNTIGVSTNKKGNAQALSHASLFKATYVTIPEPIKSVPEPATVASLGFLTIGALRGLKKKSLVRG